MYFLHDLPPDVLAEALAAGAPQQSETPFELPWPSPRWPDIPTTVISGRDDRFFPLHFQTRIARERLGLTPVVVPGGHLVALSRPAELCDALLTATTAS